MDEKLQQAFLYDFYGELLNEHQRQIYEDFVFNDLSLGEIAREEEISRQGVADMVKRCEKKLQSYEDKLHLVDKFIRIKQDVETIHELTQQSNHACPNTKKDSVSEDIMNRIAKISNQILEEL